MSIGTLHLLMLESNETDICEWPLVTASGLKSGWARDRCGPQKPKSGRATANSFCRLRTQTYDMKQFNRPLQH